MPVEHSSLPPLAYPYDRTFCTTFRVHRTNFAVSGLFLKFRGLGGFRIFFFYYIISVSEPSFRVPQKYVQTRTDRDLSTNVMKGTIGKKKSKFVLGLYHLYMFTLWFCHWVHDCETKNPHYDFVRFQTKLASTPPIHDIKPIMFGKELRIYDTIP